MTHRKYSRTRNAIHKAMARHPGERKPKWMRREMSAAERVRVINTMVVPKNATKAILEAHKVSANRPGIIRRVFNRKTGV